MTENKKIYVDGKEITEIEGKPIKYDKFGTPFIEEVQEYIGVAGKTYLNKPNYSIPERLRISQLKLEDVMPAEAVAMLPEGAKVFPFDPKLDSDKPIVIIGGYAILLNSFEEVEEVSLNIVAGFLKTSKYEGFK